jgi:hypothetical protein
VVKCGSFDLLNNLNLNAMSNKTTITVPIELVEDLSTAAEKMFEILRTKNLSEEEVARLKYVMKLLESCNDLFPKTDDNE